MEDFLYLDIPAFQVPYKRGKRYGYLKAKEKENTREALNKASGGYCMYCYTRIHVDHKLYGQLEHALEKNNSEKLVECIPNIGIACMDCNQSLKRVGEKKRMIPESVKKRFEEQSRCASDRRKQCTVPCKALRELQKSYSNMPEAEIILQPMGVYGSETGERLELRYDVLKMEFQPNTKLHAYSESESMFIQRHILRFHLNDPKYRTRGLADYIKITIDQGGTLPEYECNHMTVQLFAEKLKGKTAAERVKICSRIYTAIFLRL